MGKSEKTTEVPPPHYSNDSDVESIIKPNNQELQDEFQKPLAQWQNNVLLRTYRRRLVAVGLISTIIILAVVLGVLASRGIIGKSKPSPGCELWDSGRFVGLDYHCIGMCLEWKLYPTPSAQPTASGLVPLPYSNMYCAKWA